MNIWQNWFENRNKEEQFKNLQLIWNDTFKALGIGGLSDEDAAHQSLSHINFNSRNGEGNGTSTFRGKQAALKRLENGQIFNRLQQLGDPEVDKSIEDVKAWLGRSDEKHANAESNASTTVSTLLQKLFGDQHFQNLIDGDFPQIEEPQAQVEPQPPTDNLGPQGPNLDGGADMAVDPNQMDPNQQQPPQMPQQPMQPAPIGKPMQPQVQMAHNQSYFGQWLVERKLK